MMPSPILSINFISPVRESPLVIMIFRGTCSHKSCKFQTCISDIQYLIATKRQMEDSIDLLSGEAHISWAVGLPS